MKEFPQRLYVENKSEFDTILYDRELCYLRRDIFEHMIKEDENNYFDLEKFSREKLKNNQKIIKQMCDTIMGELEKLGWKCKTSFNGTGLFIYSTDEPPPSCYPDGL